MTYCGISLGSSGTTSTTTTKQFMTSFEITILLLFWHHQKYVFDWTSTQKLRDPNIQQTHINSDFTQEKQKKKILKYYYYYICNSSSTYEEA